MLVTYAVSRQITPERALLFRHNSLPATRAAPWSEGESALPPHEGAAIMADAPVDAPARAMTTGERMVSRETPAASVGVFGRAALTTEVIEYIHGLVGSGAWPPGMVLPAESELCSQLGVSRSVLRESVRVLASNGMLVVRHGKGTSVAPPSAWNVTGLLTLAVRAESEEFHNWLEVRSILEVAATKLAAARASSSEKQYLQETLAQLLSASTEEYTERDIALHTAIASTAHNPQIPRLLAPLLRPLREELAETAGRPDLRRRADKEHAAIIEAIVTGDVKAAAQLATEHLDRVGSEFEVLSGRTHGTVDDATPSSA